MTFFAVSILADDVEQYISTELGWPPTNQVSTIKAGLYHMDGSSTPI
jgi:hypothetical protein